jgi:hypothetical protein
MGIGPVCGSSSECRRDRFIRSKGDVSRRYGAQPPFHSVRLAQVKAAALPVNSK